MFFVSQKKHIVWTGIQRIAQLI